MRKAHAPSRARLSLFRSHARTQEVVLCADIGLLPMRLPAISLLTAIALAQHPLTLDPAHYTVAFQNDRVRALRVRNGPGEGSPMHEHPHGVGVAMTDTRGRFEAPDGSGREASGTSAGTL